MNPVRELKKIAVEIETVMQKQAGPPEVVKKWNSNEWREWKARSRFPFDTPEEKAEHMKQKGYDKEEAMECIEANFPGITKPDKKKIEKIFKEKKK